jgi:hypothetical protein
MLQTSKILGTTRGKTNQPAVESQPSRVTCPLKRRHVQRGTLVVQTKGGHEMPRGKKFPAETGRGRRPRNKNRQGPWMDLPA